MKINVLNDDGTAKVDNGVPVTRDETRDEILERLREKYEPLTESNDPWIANEARERCDWLDVIGMTGGAVDTGPQVDDLTKRVEQIEARMSAV